MRFRAWCLLDKVVGCECVNEFANYLLAVHGAGGGTVDGP